MPDKKHPKSSSTSPPDSQSKDNDDLISQVPEVVFDRRTGEITLIAPSGERSVIKAKFIEQDDEDDEETPAEPLTVEQLHDALERLDKLGLTWTADSPPAMVTKEEGQESSFGSAEYKNIQTEYPNLPTEVSVITTFVLTGNRALASLVGGESLLPAKAELLKRFLITAEYRSEFFFKHAIKIPYLADIDWEVVLKLDEKGVERWPAASYGILSLLLREPFTAGRASHRRSITAAVNEASVDSFIEIFQDLKESLINSRDITKSIPWEDENDENDDESDDGGNTE